MKKYSYEKMYANLEVIKKKGCNAISALSLIKNNPILLEYCPDDLDKKLSFIFNHEKLYAALLINGDYYEWSTYDDDTFSEFKCGTIIGEETDDYIVDMIVDFIYNNKISKMRKDIPLEELVYQFKNKMKTNSTGYHLK